jgi:hypothetical protein
MTEQPHGGRGEARKKARPQRGKETPARPRSQPPNEADDIEALYSELLHLFYDREDREQAEKLARRLEAALAAPPDIAGSIRAEEVRSLLAELRGDFAEAARSREAEIRKILELHLLSINTPNWPFVFRQYDYSDLSDRLDLLAILYAEQGDLERAVATLLESKQLCEAHQVPFDGKDLLRDFEKARANGERGRSRRKRMAPSGPERRRLDHGAV